MLPVSNPGLAMFQLCHSVVVVLSHGNTVIIIKEGSRRESFSVREGCPFTYQGVQLIQ